MTYLISNNPGAYTILNFKATRLDIVVDVSGLTGVAANLWPRIEWNIDGGNSTTRQLVSGDTSITLASNLKWRIHTCKINLQSTDSEVDRWSTPIGAVKITGFNIPNNGILYTPASTKTGRLLSYGDSITEGAWSLNAPNGLYSLGEKAQSSYIQQVANGLNCECGVVAFGSQGWNTAGRGNVPVLTTSWNLYSSGNNRLNSGLFNPQPDWVILAHGTNDSGNVSTMVQAMLNNIRAAAPLAKIAVLKSLGGAVQSYIQSGFDAYQLASPDSNCKIVTWTGSWDTTDGAHPSVDGHITLAGLVLAAIKTTFGIS